MPANVPIVLASNGGVHSPDRLAALAVSQISDLIQIDEGSVTAEAVAARKALPLFQIAAANAIEPYIADVYLAEIANVGNNPSLKRNDPFNVDSFITSALADVMATAVGTPFDAPIQSHLAEFQSAVGNILAQTFVDAANVQRSTSLDALGR